MSLVRNGVISSTDQKVGPKYYENYEKIFGVRKVGGPHTSTAKLRRKDRAMALDYSGSSISKMMQDRTLVRHIKSGNASDPGVKREALQIEREARDRRVESQRKVAYQKLEQCRIELKKSGGFAQ